MDRMISTELMEEDIAVEGSLRPQNLSEYIGQEKVKKNLRVFIEAAKMRGEALDHVLLYGPPGLGKTTLAGIIANEMDSNLKITSGPAIEKPGEIAAVLNGLSDGDVLVMAGSIPDVMPQTIYMDIMKYLADKDLKIVVDATKDLLVNVLQYHPFLIKPNNHELGEIFGVKITEKEDVITYAKKMQEKGAGNVLVSMAGDGAVLVAEDGSIFQAEAPKGKVVNSVGAGDSMVAGFVTGYLKTGSYKEAFQMGVCTGSASAFSEELATEPEVLALLDKNKGIFK